MSIKFEPPAIAPLDIAATIDRGEARITLTGEIDISNADQVLSCADRYLNDPGINRVTADLAALTFIDSSGLRALAFSRRHADALDKTFRILNQQEQVTRVLEATGLDKYLTDPTYPR